MFTITDYQKKPVFANMLAGIAGTQGIPCWCFTLNRGQCISGFGVRNKDQAILPFAPMAQAQKNIRTQGFRSFLKWNGTYYEPFTNKKIPHAMDIDMCSLSLHESNGEIGLAFHVDYYGLPNMPVGGLVREVVFENTSDHLVTYELLDGLSTLMPYGVSLWMDKMMGQTVQAWMQVIQTDDGLPYFQVRTSVEDSVAVSSVEGGNFAYALDAQNNRLAPFYDPALVFSYDTALEQPENFIEKGLEWLCVQPQQGQNRLPCCLFGKKGILKPGEKTSLVTLYAQGASKGLCDSVAKVLHNRAAFEFKRKESEKLMDDITKPIFTRTGNPVFDAYCRQTFLDNVLRGGIPIQLGGDKVFHLYSRKHGDLERDYNDFQLSFEPYAQGNGNFRDVCQNRRSDVLYAPFSGLDNIHTFLELLQLDGYNPLVIMPTTFTLNHLEKAMSKAPKLYQPPLKQLLLKPFTPGQLSLTLDGNEEAMGPILKHSTKDVNANFSEGYWTDHWTYLLDLFETYLAVYPKEKENLLFKGELCRFYNAQAAVNPRVKRCVETEKGIRQYNPITHLEKTKSKWAQDQNGQELQSMPIEKLVMLSVLKYANLDPYGCGLDMEAGKPGWYDALNGLPGLFGSSVSELYELQRLMDFIIPALKAHSGNIMVYAQWKAFFDALTQLTQNNMAFLLTSEDITPFWQSLNDLKENYRQQALSGFSGEKLAIGRAALANSLQNLRNVVKRGIEKALRTNNGFPPTYFYYEVTKFAKAQDGILPLNFLRHDMPLFLEGAVRYMKLAKPQEENKRLAKAVKESPLYDEKLRMYKVNAPLKGLTFEAGRTVAFTPGWLENESVWLHMEYKYLLALLQNGLYEEFEEAFNHCLIPLQDPEVYGRSPLENVSFIASSANPDPAYHGRGFVARLSGSTAEFVQMWQWMMIGKEPFSLNENGDLQFNPSPFIPESLMPEDGELVATLLGKTEVRYHVKGLKSLVPGGYEIVAILSENKPIAVEKLRDLKYEKIDIEIRSAI